MRIALLTNQDLDADPFPADDWPCDPRPFLPDAQWEVLTLQKGEAPTRLPPLAERFDVFFNLCDGAADQHDVPGIEVVETLEAMGVAFTGATSSFYEPTRQAMKRAARRAGVRVPRGFVAKTTHDVDKAARTLTFPLFVKHHNSYASVDITRASRVVSPAGLRRQATKFMERFGFCSIEEYVDGPEVTVLVAENPDDPARPITYQPLQYTFPPGEAFKHAKLKWVDYGGLSVHPVTEPRLDARLRRAAARVFVELGGTSFGRCDLRLDAAGRPVFLEINPNCGVFYPPTDPGSADLCLLHDPAGHAGFARLLVACAQKRAALAPA